ncbi:glycosyltransferase [Bifidobacterium tibiigranuli]|jgi:glycosyltransferase involved in cell wall biosynthesis|nr:glycosyltransferase [Bifidobacterium tibiigranuli]MCI1649348.1 glycosyltransferase [Bifidobacterium tibiigranuli]MCI1674339.1 glycosyltransferase [Bifidobacterium tibiigranuli]MCI1713271.1 glycosyltransferase [Bifidobacterium tibiigranuli]MCI2184678.1 glycosyltransferase [Bifidobacterium tibiigranuli]MCI2204708.1 glycosyltransferase [Bifidobacterium tibiigranuli]
MLGDGQVSAGVTGDAAADGESTGETPMTPPFSVLMAVYAGDERDYLRRAVLSNTLEQTCVPTQLVIVRDGPVPASIQAFLDGLDVWLGKAFAQVGRHDSLPEITVLELARNSGLAHALNQGLRRCRYDLVARADSDDISLPARFATIIPLLDGPHGESHRAPQHDSRGEREHVGHYDIVGSAIREFSGDERHPGQARTLPAGGKKLLDFARVQSPLHHPSVAFRKSAVQRVGGYPEHSGRFEDYLLWERLILAGARLHNVAEPLVLYRVDAGAYQRRGGWAMFRDELALQRRFRADGFTSAAQFVRNVAIRALYRLMPTGLRKLGYRALIALRNAGRKLGDVSGSGRRKAQRNRGSGRSNERSSERSSGSNDGCNDGLSNGRNSRRNDRGSSSDSSGHGNSEHSISKRSISEMNESKNRSAR